MRIALFEPDIPQNTGNIFRLSACLGIPVDIIEPTGFILDNNTKKLLEQETVRIQYLENIINKIESILPQKQYYYIFFKKLNVLLKT